MRLLVRLAFQNVLQGGRRVVLLMSALAFATFFLVLVTALFSGVSERLMSAGTAILAGDINLGGIFRAGNNRVTFAVVEAEKLAGLVRESEPEVVRVVARHEAVARVVSDTRISTVWVQGVDITNEPELARLLNENLLGERSQGDVVSALSEPQSLVLFLSQAKKLNLGVGDRVTLWAKNTRGANNSVDVTVVAIVKDLGALTASSAFLDFETCRSLLDLKAGSAGRLRIQLRDPAQQGAVRARLSEHLIKAGMDVMPYHAVSLYGMGATAMAQVWKGQRLFLSTSTDDLADYSWRVVAAQGITALLGLILVIVIGIGIMNSMLVTVQQRAREIGTLRALGMSRLAVVGMFLCEAVLLALVSGGFGGTVGLGAGKLLDLMAISVESPAFRDIYFSDVLGFSVSASLFAGVLLLFVLVAAASSVWPALRAARQRPAVAIRSMS